jgi:hypothetical protein
MPKVRATRGVCIGVENHLAAGEVRDLPDDQTLKYLLSINSVVLVEEAPPPPPVEPVAESKPEDEKSDEKDTKKKATKKASD